MNRIGQNRRGLACVFLVGWLAVMLFSGCGYTLVKTQDLLDQTDEELLEAMEDEVPGVTPAERLENQLIAVLNLDRDDDHQVTASTSLDDASSFFMELILQEPQLYISTQTGKDKLQSLLGKDTYAFVYDGKLTSAKAGSQCLSSLKALDKELSLQYFTLQSLSVNYGQDGSTSAWLILVQYVSEGGNT